MVKDVYFGNTLRKSFIRRDEITQMPDLLEIQKKSYQWFFDVGLKQVFKDVGVINDYAGNLELSFIDYSMNKPPKYDVEECKARDATYSKPIHVKVRLRNKETEEIKEQEIYMGDFPLMTQGGSFVINGAERVIVSQIVRSPGMYYGREEDKAGNVFYTMSALTKTASFPSPACSAQWVSRRTLRSWRSLARIPALSPHWRRTPARPTRRPCWRSTADSAPASPPRWTPARA